jgi:hypothetical protein
MRNAYKIMARNPEGKILFVRFRGGWKDNIKIDLK